jgi:dihydrofolate synthase / folylpolyglutamate synthase
MISYQCAVESLYALGHELHSARKFDLAHMRVLCQALGNPQRKFPSVLIAGTNGKGSTAATLASILQASSHRVGLFTSPHLLRINERICFCGQPIPDSAFADAYQRVTAVASALVAASALPHRPSFFETMTAIAFDFFASSGVEIAVLEAGMGGRLDATNIVEPILCVITDIDLDHQKFLGNTLAAIATEKAGILRPGVAAVTLPQHPEANQVLGERIAAVGARPVNAARNLPSTSPQGPASATGGPGASGRSGICCRVPAAKPSVGPYPPSAAAGEESVPASPPSAFALAHRLAGPASAAARSALETRFPLRVLGHEVEIVSPLLGRHQFRNLALAITAAEELAAQGFRITPQSVACGTRQTVWPARFQRFAATAHRPEVVVDVAHNPAGAWALRSALAEQLGERPLVLLFAAMADKAVGEMAQILWPQMAHVVLTRVADNPRAAAPADLALLAQSLGVEHSVSATVPEGMDRATAQALKLGPHSVIVIAGSIYLAGEALPILP